MQFKIVHVSDLHAGPLFDVDAAARVVEELGALAPDLVVVSGDLVLRADFDSQWVQANDFLKALPKPQMVVAGNHDVPMYNMYRRLFSPLGIYRRRTILDLNPVVKLDGLTAVGGCSAHGLTVEGGRLSGGQRRAIDAALSAAPAGDWKLLTLHHHLIAPPGCSHRRPIANRNWVLDMLERHKVDLYLCGHVHVSWLSDTRSIRSETAHPTIICQSGTATSTRGKAAEISKNSYNLLEFDATSVRIARFVSPGRGAPFAQAEEKQIARAAAPHAATS